MSIQITNLSIAYTEKPVLKRISLEIRPGDFLSIIGPNGAGKSTLLKCLCGILPHWSGEIELTGKPLQKFSTRERARHISYVPQSIGHRLPFRVADFVAMGRYPHLSPFSTLTPADHANIEQALETVGMQPFRDRQMDTLSGGERQMVLIAAALAQGGKILVLDEPVTFLDYHHQVQVMQTLQQLNREKNYTIISVNHDLHTALQFSTRLAALKDGELIRTGSPEDFRKPACLQEIYGTPFCRQEQLIPEGLL